MDENSSLLVLILLTFSLYLWRVAIPVGAAMFLGWLVSLATSLNTAYFSYALMFAGLALGVMWQVRARAAAANSRKPASDVGD